MKIVPAIIASERDALAVFLPRITRGSEASVRDIANSYGNFDAAAPPDGYRFIIGDNIALAGACKRHSVQYLRLRSGFQKTRHTKGRYFKPVFHGVVVRFDHAIRMACDVAPEQLDAERFEIYNSDEH